MNRHQPVREVFRKDPSFRVKSPYRGLGKYLSGLYSTTEHLVSRIGKALRDVFG